MVNMRNTNNYIEVWMPVDVFRKEFDQNDKYIDKITYMKDSKGKVLKAIID